MHDNQCREIWCVLQCSVKMVFKMSFTYRVGCISNVTHFHKDGAHDTTDIYDNKNLQHKATTLACRFAIGLCLSKFFGTARWWLQKTATARLARL